MRFVSMCSCGKPLTSHRETGDGLYSTWFRIIEFLPDGNVSTFHECGVKRVVPRVTWSLAESTSATPEVRNDRLTFVCPRCTHRYLSTRDEGGVYTSGCTSIEFISDGSVTVLHRCGHNMTLPGVVCNVAAFVPDMSVPVSASEAPKRRPRRNVYPPFGAGKPVAPRSRLFDEL